MPIFDLDKAYAILDQNRGEADRQRSAEAMARAREEANTITGMPNFQPGGSIAEQALRARLQLIREREEADMVGNAIAAIQAEEATGGGAGGVGGGTAPGGMSLQDALRRDDLESRYKRAADVANKAYKTEIDRQKRLQPEPGFVAKVWDWFGGPTPPPGISNEKARGNAATNIQKAFPPGMLEFDEDADSFLPKYPTVLPPGGLAPSVPAPTGPGVPTRPGGVGAQSTRDRLIEEVLDILKKRNEILAQPPPPRQPTGYEPTQSEREWRERIGGEIMRRREQGPQGRLPYLWRSVPMNPRGVQPPQQSAPIAPSAQAQPRGEPPAAAGAPALPFPIVPTDSDDPGTRLAPPDRRHIRPGEPGYGVGKGLWHMSQPPVWEPFGPSSNTPAPGDVVPGPVQPRVTPGSVMPGPAQPRVLPGDVVSPDESEPQTPIITYPGQGTNAPARIQIVPPGNVRRGSVDPRTGRLIPTR